VEIQGYPAIFIIITLALGIPLAILKPYEAFLLSILLLTAGDAVMFNRTRTTLLGPYLNLGDVCVLILYEGAFANPPGCCAFAFCPDYRCGSELL